MIDYIRKGEWAELKCPSCWGLQGEELTLELAKATGVSMKLTSQLMKQSGIQVKADRLRLRLFPMIEDKVPPNWTELPILYEDDFILVVNKSAGLKVHPSNPNDQDSLNNQVSAYYMSTGQSCLVKPIHRLDVNTTGPVLFAKNEFAGYTLDEAMRNKEIERIYLAYVGGVPARKNGSIREPIGKDRHHNQRRRVSASGQPAVTEYAILHVYESAQCAQVRLWLRSGRTHQIRVHMAHLGLPLLGDTLYGGSTRYLQRQALHGEQLRFKHPWSQQEIVVECAKPQDLLLLEEKLKNVRRMDL